MTNLSTFSALTKCDFSWNQQYAKLGSCSGNIWECFVSFIYMLVNGINFNICSGRIVPRDLMRGIKSADCRLLNSFSCVLQALSFDWSMVIGNREQLSLVKEAALGSSRPPSSSTSQSNLSTNSECSFPTPPLLLNGFSYLQS